MRQKKSKAEVSATRAKAGALGGEARKKSLTAARRIEIARQAVAAREAAKQGLNA